VNGDVPKNALFLNKNPGERKASWGAFRSSA
jgi:hypothetical protein